MSEPPTSKINTWCQRSKRSTVMGFNPCMQAGWLITPAEGFSTALFTIPQEHLVCNWSKLSGNKVECFSFPSCKCGKCVYMTRSTEWYIWQELSGTVSRFHQVSTWDLVKVRQDPYLEVSVSHIVLRSLPGVNNIWMVPFQSEERSYR